MQNTAHYGEKILLHTTLGVSLGKHKAVISSAEDMKGFYSGKTGR